MPLRSYLLYRLTSQKDLELYLFRSGTTTNVVKWEGVPREVPKCVAEISDVFLGIAISQRSNNDPIGDSGRPLNLPLSDLLYTRLSSH
jgi:hypothetical protein